MIPVQLQSRLPDPESHARGVAADILQCEPADRPAALVKVYAIYRAVALAEGCDEVTALAFGRFMHRLVQEAMQAIEASGGRSVGRA